ncbi:MAG: class I SAM-dependent methyltransferase [Candidatus Jordarchaeaceae archaeon]
MKNGKKVTSKEKMSLYDQTAWIYNKRYGEIQEEKYRSILSKIVFEKADLILDAGCGTGMLLEKLSSKNTAIGIDFSKEMLIIAKNKIKNSILIQADLNSLPFKDNTFSKIFGVTVLQNIEYPQIAVRELVRVLKEKGLTILSTLKKKLTKKELQELVKDTGLKEKEVYEVSEDIVIIAYKHSLSKKE